MRALASVDLSRRVSLLRRSRAVDFRARSWRWPLAWLYRFVLTLILAGSEDSGAVPIVSTRAPMFWIFGMALFFSAHAMLGVQQNLISYLTGAPVSPKEAALILRS